MPPALRARVVRFRLLQIQCPRGEKFLDAEPRGNRLLIERECDDRVQSLSIRFDAKRKWIPDNLLQCNGVFICRGEILACGKVREVNCLGGLKRIEKLASYFGILPSVESFMTTPWLIGYTPVFRKYS